MTIQELLEELGPGWCLTMADPSGYDDDHRFWAWLPSQFGGSDDVYYCHATPEGALRRALVGNGEPHP